MIRFIGIAAAIAALGVVTYPFGREAYQRYQVSRMLDSAMDAKDRAALDQWNGNARSFSKSLLDRCEREQGAGAPACDRYRLAGH